MLETRCWYQALGTRCFLGINICEREKKQEKAKEEVNEAPKMSEQDGKSAGVTGTAYWSCLTVGCHFALLLDLSSPSKEITLGEVSSCSKANPVGAEELSDHILCSCAITPFLKACSEGRISRSTTAVVSQGCLTPAHKDWLLASLSNHVLW